MFVIALFVFSVGIAYSGFTSNSLLSTVDQKIAKFVFDTETLDRLELPLISMVPGQSEEYNFSISNSSDNISSDVTILYQLSLLTPHFTPLIIELYKDDELVMTCDESYSRNDNNELVCNSPILELSHVDEGVDDYTLKITFDSLYSDESYSNLIDYINIEIKSYQKV
jgi:hypothetical protein